MTKKCKNKEPYTPLPEYLAIGPSQIYLTDTKNREDANCELVEDDNDDYKKVKTLRKIEKGEELTLKYSLYEICDYL